ncbi:YheC/YheD family protein [Tumebacillus sp. ITR2]|uniref:YheC/YheD family protein n=1 Tax=Tumebacillus amylolyticus TaxID=2801339 RepID=A0ABS1J4I1_9BACL|nr:YheC/YheD family protein [Tumebacillus amylolyticus]MBL0385178.1 YheC/YheD family protein [Tumebacillus amylolyticus]
MKKRKPELGKWGCWRFFAQVPQIKKYLPETAVLTQVSLQKFLGKYSSVYVKPSAGWGGRGITKVWKREDSGYSFVVERGKAVHSKTISELYRQLRARQRPGITYIVQRGIQLAKINERPYDIRLMMMRVHGKWEYVGMLAKVAGPNSVITNVARGKGYVSDIDTALKKSLGLSETQRAKLKKEMVTLAHRTVNRFEDWKHYSQIGLDLAVDTSGRLWMIEENTGPAHSLFAKLRDPRMYRRIKEITRIWRKARR